MAGSFWRLWRENPFSGFFQPLLVTCFSWPVATSSVYKAHYSSVCFLWTLFSSSTVESLCCLLTGTLKILRSTQVIQNNFPILISSPPHICKVPCTINSYMYRLWRWGCGHLQGPLFLLPQYLVSNIYTFYPYVLFGSHNSFYGSNYHLHFYVRKWELREVKWPRFRKPTEPRFRSFHPLFFPTNSQ